MDDNILLLQKKSKAEIFGIIDSAINIAASRWPQDFLARKNLTLEKLFASDDCVSRTSSIQSSCCPVPAKEADKKNDEVPAATTTSSDNNNKKKAQLIIRLKLPPAKPDVASKKADKNEDAPATTSDNIKKKARHVIRLKLPAAKPEDAKDQSKKPPLVVQETTAVCCEVPPAKEAQESAVPINVGQEDNLVQQPKLVDEDLFKQKLEASKRKLHERYQQIQDSKKRIRVVDLADAPKPTADPKRSRFFR